MPHGLIGDWIVAGVNFLSDPLADVKIAGAILAIIILPQILAYILSGIFGAALTIRLFPTIWKAMVWFVVKGFASVAGLFLALCLFGLFLPIFPDGSTTILQMTLVSLLLLIMSFALIWLTFDFQQTLHSPSASKQQACLARGNAFSRLHGWATRHIK